MGATMSTLAQAIRSDRAVARRLTLSAILLAAAVIVGGVERRQIAPLNLRKTQLETTAARVRQFRSSFVPIAPAESASWKQMADSIDIAVPRGSRLSLAQTLAKSAEDAGLRGVRVSFGKPDSSYVPPRSRGVSTSDVQPADYAISIDAGGAFAQVLSFINALPPTVSVTRLVGSHDKRDTHYRITIAVYETNRDSQTD